MYIYIYMYMYIYIYIYMYLHATPSTPGHPRFFFSWLYVFVMMFFLWLPMLVTVVNPLDHVRGRDEGTIYIYIDIYRERETERYYIYIYKCISPTLKQAPNPKP